MSVLARPSSQRRSIIPWLFPAGLGLVVLVNMVMLFFALDTFPGVATRNAYERGRNYGQVLDRDAAIAAMGWQVEIRFTPDNGGGLVVRYRDREGKPIPGLQPDAVLTRPVGAGPRVAARLREIVAGEYRADLVLPQRGQWDVQVVAGASPMPHIAAVRLNLR